MGGRVGIYDTHCGRLEDLTLPYPPLLYSTALYSTLLYVLYSILLYSAPLYPVLP